MSDLVEYDYDVSLGGSKPLQPSTQVDNMQISKKEDTVY